MDSFTECATAYQQPFQDLAALSYLAGQYSEALELATEVVEHYWAQNRETIAADSGATADEMNEFVDLPMKESVESFAARFDMIVQDLVVQEKCTSDGKTVAGYLQTW